MAERLQVLPRPGAPARISADQLSQIVALACEKPEDSQLPMTHWTSREIAYVRILSKLVIAGCCQ